METRRGTLFMMLTALAGFSTLVLTSNLSLT